MSRKRYLPVLMVFLSVILLQVFLMITNQEFYLKELTKSAYYTLVVIGLCVLMGYAGQISLGHAGFFAIGGYSSAVLTTNNLIAFANVPFVLFCKKIGILVQRTNLYDETILAFSPGAAFILAMIITVIIAFIIGIPVIRLKGHYLAMATLGFGLIVFALIGAVKVFGEHEPITQVPPFKLLLGLEINGRLPFRVMNYYFAWILVFLVLILVINLINSRAGRALKSIHGNEGAALSLGINTAKYKLYVFVFSAVLASIAGILMTHYSGSIGDSEASVMKSVRYVAIVAVGGMSNIWGTVSMSVVLNFLSMRDVFGKQDDLVFGIILILVMLFAPDGLLQPKKLKKAKDKLIDLIKRIIRKIRKRKENESNS